MSEKYNLIPAAELPTTEAEEVDVLCVEGGELKRKPAANLGGGSGGGYVIEIADVPESALEPDESGYNIIDVTDISYDEFLPQLVSGGSVWVDISSLFANSGMAGIFARGTVLSWFFMPAELASGANMLVLFANVTVLVDDITTIPMALTFTGTGTPEGVGA